MSASTILANWRGEKATDYYTKKIKGWVFIDTPGHGYLGLGSDDNGYSDALEIARSSGSYSPILDGGLVFLEEDCDMHKFLEVMEGYGETNE